MSKTKTLVTIIEFLKYTHLAECGECVHGTCTSPGVCTCHPGFEGENCETCQTHPECMFGSCFDAPFQCNCYHGYEGYFCDTPICTEGCQNVSRNIKIWFPIINIVTLKQITALCKNHLW